MFNPAWHIRSRARQCALSGKDFADEEPIISAIFPDPESDGYLRQDFCLAAWQQRPPEAPSPFSSWRGVYHPPEARKEPVSMARQDPEDLLRHLIEEDAEHTENTRYILAVMLERKKILRETDSQRLNGAILRVYEHRKTGESLVIRDPNIPLDQVETLQEEVITLLGQNSCHSEPGEETVSPPAKTEAPPAPQTATIADISTP